MNRKRRRRRSGDDIVAGRGNARHEHEERIVAASRWKRSDDVTAERELPAQAVGVDDGKRAGDRDGFRDSPNRELGVHDCGGRTRQLDPVSLVRPPAVARETDRIRSRSEILDAVLPSAVGHGKASPFDQSRTSRLHDNRGQGNSRSVFDGTGNRALGESE